MRDKLIKLESQLAFQDRTVEELNKVVCKQQNQIDVLIREVTTLKQRVNEFQSQVVVDASEEAPPPHY